MSFLLVGGSSIVLKWPHTSLDLGRFGFFYLSLDIAYCCKFTAFHHINNVLSKSKRAVKKHLAKAHGIDHTRGKTKRTGEEIDTVCLQFFCGGNHYLSFVVRTATEPWRDREAWFSSAANDVSPLHADLESSKTMSAGLDQKYTSSQQQRRTAFDRLGDSKIFTTIKLLLGFR